MGKRLWKSWSMPGPAVTTSSDGKTEKEDGKHEFDAHFRGALLGFLTAANTEEFGLCAQGFAYAGAESIGLNEDGDELFDFVFASATGEIAQGIRSTFSGHHFHIE